MATCAEIDALIHSIRIQKASIEKQLTKLQAIESTEDVTAWCTDYTLDLSGTVGTMEILKQFNSSFNWQQIDYSAILSDLQAQLAEVEAEIALLEDDNQAGGLA